MLSSASSTSSVAVLCCRAGFGDICDSHGGANEGRGGGAAGFFEGAAVCEAVAVRTRSERSEGHR